MNSTFVLNTIDDGVMHITVDRQDKLDAAGPWSFSSLGRRRDLNETRWLLLTLLNSVLSCAVAQNVNRYAVHPLLRGAVESFRELFERAS